MTYHKTHSPSKKKKGNHYLLAVLGGIVFGIVLVLAALYTSNVTSTNESCAACHVHPEAETSWKQSVHYNNESGVQTNCVECHLPPSGTAHHYWEKAKMGLHDVWMHLTHDKEELDFESKRTSSLTAPASVATRTSSRRMSRTMPWLPTSTTRRTRRSWACNA